MKNDILECFMYEGIFDGNDKCTLTELTPGHMSAVLHTSYTKYFNLYLIIIFYVFIFD